MFSAAILSLALLSGDATAFKLAQAELALFERALNAKKGDKAGAIAAGKRIWAGWETRGPRPLAQEWMSWALPARCHATATRMVGR